MSSKQWSNVLGQFTIELYRYEGKVFETDTGGEVDFQFIRDIPMDDEHVYEIIIDFESSGYFDPGNTYGLPENCWPPEGEDDRELVSAYVYSTSCVKGTEERPLTTILSKEEQNILFDHFQEKIDEVELESPD